MPEISLAGLTQRILQTTPGVQNHPEILLAALERAKPMLDAQGKSDLDDVKQQFATQRLKFAQQRLDDARQFHAQSVAAQQAAEAGRADRFDRANPQAPAAGGAATTPPPAPAIATPPTVSAPPLAMLKPNTITTFQNGQRWTIGADGQPKQVP